MRLISRARTLWARWRATKVPTRFGMARIYETDWGDRKLRVLDIAGTYQSGTYLDEWWCDVPFPYLAKYDVVFSMGSPVRRMCMLGGGGYAYPKHVIAHHDPTRIDVVEVDPAITRLAHEYFLLDRLREDYHTDQTHRLGLVCDDAWHHIQSCARSGRTYDAILNDCFVAEQPERHFLAPEAASVVHACLNPGGTYAANVISALEGPRASLLMRTVACLSSAFLHVCVLPSKRVRPDQVDNVLVIATDSTCLPEGAIRLFDAEP